jgi:hypothetical protein
LTLAAVIYLGFPEAGLLVGANKGVGLIGLNVLRIGGYFRLPCSSPYPAEERDFGVIL